MQEYIRVIHDFGPVFDQNSRVLILGTMPSVKSREAGFYYGHPQNRFWQVMTRLFSAELPETIEEKRELLLANGVALWDVIASCDIIGASDQSIRNVEPTDVRSLLALTGIQRVYANGALAKKLYDKYTLAAAGVNAIQLPSTSPANARYRLEDLVAHWKRILTDKD